VVAQNIPEDIGAAQYGTVCHKDYYGNFAKPEQVGTTPYTDAGKELNRLARARVAALGKRRDDLINAFNVVFADQDTTFLGNLKALLTRMAPLYDADIPNLTGSTASALNAIDQSQDAVNGLTQILNHNNYSNLTAGGGLLGVVATQAKLPQVLDDTYRLFGHGSSNETTFNQLLFALEDGAQTQTPVAAGTRSLLNVLGDVAVTESAQLNAPGTDNLTALRGACGNAKLTEIAAPFVDLNQDGCADTDVYGRFVDATGQVITAPTPFMFTASTFLLNGLTLNVDGLSQPLNADGSLFFQYTNARHTVVANFVAGSQPLFAPGQATVTTALTQLGPALGDLTATKVQHGLGSETITNFSADTSPAYDLALAFAPILRAAATNDFEPLTTLSTVLKNNPQDGARVIAALVNAKNLANQDTQAQYAPTSTMWDEINDALVAIADAKDPVSGQPLGLIEKVLDGMSAQTQATDVTFLADALPALLGDKDQIDYDASANNLNGPPVNAAGGSPSPHVPVDRSQPTVSTNRSLFQRIVGMMAEGRGVTACNKAGATIAGLPGPGTNMTWDECTIFKVPDVSVFLLDTIATGGNATSPVALAGKGAFPLTPDTEGGAVDAIKILVASTGNDATDVENGFNKLMQDTSGVTGLTFFPTPQAMSRMVLYRAPASLTAGDTAQYYTFIPGIAAPVATNVCPYDPDVFANDLAFGRRKCALTPGGDANLMANRWQATLFALEANNFYVGMQPLVAPFVMAGREDLLLNLFTALNRHWASPQDASRSSQPSDPTYSSGANFATYEPLLAKIFARSSDLLPAVQALSKDLVAAGGSAKITPLVYSFLSQAQNTGLTDRRGYSTSNRNDGTQNSYTTPALLTVQALDEIDIRRSQNPANLATWRGARSQLVDTLFATTTVNGTVSLTNQGLQAGLPLLLDAAATELRKQPDYNAFITVNYPNDMRSAIESPALEALTTLVAVLHQDSTAEQNLQSLIASTLDPSNAASFAEVSLSLVSTVAALNDAAALQPVTQVAAGALDPQTGALKMVLTLMQDTRAIDSDNDFEQLLARLATPLAGQAQTPLSILSDTFVEVQRYDPTQTSAAFDQRDTHHLLEQTASFLNDPQHGLDQLITIIQKRTSLQ
jgi:hypothetical protein